MIAAIHRAGAFAVFPILCLRRSPSPSSGRGLFPHPALFGELTDDAVFVGVGIQKARSSFSMSIEVSKQPAVWGLIENSRSGLWKYLPLRFADQNKEYSDHINAELLIILSGQQFEPRDTIVFGQKNTGTSGCGR
ncbi:MAG: hypothetical protein IPL01_16600 [Acidobacteria bacterium]|nr:hypothetical protein [Acidobacteriota bacterium]